MSHSKFRLRGRTAGIPSLAVMLSIFIALLAFPRASHSQTGTVTGRVTDREGQPVSDVLVIIRGTGLGSRTSADGRYSIARVPVGVWSLQAMRAGMKRAQATIVVNADRPTVESFQLEVEPFRIPVLDVHGSDKTDVGLTRSDTRHKLTIKDLRSFPVEGLKELIALKAGVTSFQGEIHFRAGRADEVLTIVNGIPSRNPLRAEGVDLGLLAVHTSVQVLGGMDAQYGNALSGIIALMTREGTDDFGGEIRYFTDRYGERDKSFTNFERLSFGLGGPFLFPRTNYFVALQGTFTDTYLRNASERRERRFLDFIRLGNRQSSAANVSAKTTWRPSPDQKLNVEWIRNGSVSDRYHNRWNRKGFVQVVQDSTAPTDGSIIRQYGTWSYYPIDSTYVPMNTANHLPVESEDYQQIAVTWRHTLGRQSIYNVRVSRQDWRSTTDVLDRQPWEYEQQPNQYYDPFNRIDGAYYVTNGDYPFYERRATTTYTINGDLTVPFHKHNFMVGGDLNYNDLQYLLTHFPNVLDANGNYGATRDEFRNFNPEGSFFVQDKWEYQGMVMNAGIRYDTFSVGTQIAPADVADPVKTQWSPRIGFAYPITDRDVMSFHYGRMFQVPDRLFVYQGRNISAEARGNPNLEPETTISYQLAMQHQFSDEVYGQFGVYFKDIFGLLTTVDQEIPGFAATVPTYVNGDYASARGIEVTLIKNRSHGYSGEINYTYGNAAGTASDPNRALASRGNLRDQFKPTSEVPLDWDQRHMVSATLRVGDETNWAASFVFQFGTGFPFTPEQRRQRRQDPGLINSERLPSTSTLSVQAERLFRIWGQDVTFYVQGTNLLNAKNISELQPSLWPNNQVSPTSYIVYYTETRRAGGAFLTADRDGDGIDDWFAVNDPRVFQQGRVIRVGLGVEF